MSAKKFTFKNIFKGKKLFFDLINWLKVIVLKFFYFSYIYFNYFFVVAMFIIHIFVKNSLFKISIFHINFPWQFSFYFKYWLGWPTKIWNKPKILLKLINSYHIWHNWVIFWTIFYLRNCASPNALWRWRRRIRRKMRRRRRSSRRRNLRRRRREWEDM